MTTNPPTQRHYDCLDGLRAVLALYVVMHHCWIGVYLPHATTLSPAFLVFVLGRYAVCFFLVLSGFCLALPTLPGGFTLECGLIPFLRRRAWRILPPYYFALVLSILVDLPINHLSGPMWSMMLPVTWINTASHVLLLHNFMPSHLYKINGAFWSIPIEWQIYFFFPLLLLGWRRLGPGAATVLAIVVSLVLELAINDRFQRQPCAHFIGLFALGMLAARVGTVAKYARLPWLAILAAAWAAFAATFYVGNQIAMDLSFGVVASVMLAIMFLYPQGRLHRTLDWKPLVFIGSFSYSIYLVHAPILLILWLAAEPLNTHPNVMCLALLAVGLPLIVALSYLFHLACEKPFLRLRGRKVVHVP